MTDDILLLDLGGTNLRVGYGNKDQKSVLKISKQKIHSNEELHKIIQEIVEGSNTSEIVMSVAGPKRDNKITMTNRNLVLDEIELKKIQKQIISICSMIGNQLDIVCHFYKMKILKL